MSLILKSKYHNQKSITVNNKTYPVEVIKLSEIWPSVKMAKIHRGQKFYEPLLKDIDKNGMTYPIMVVHAKLKEIMRQKQIWKDKIRELPFDPIAINKAGGSLADRQYVVWGGSNRYFVAKQLGFSHIDCAIIPTFEEAYALQKHFRINFADYYGIFHRK
jgi:hypothetical protein